MVIIMDHTTSVVEWSSADVVIANEGCHDDDSYYHHHHSIVVMMMMMVLQ